MKILIVILTLLSVSRMHDQSVLLRNGSVLLVGGRTSPIHMCTQLLKIEFIREGQQGSKVMCTKCGKEAEVRSDCNEKSCPEELILVEGNSSVECGSDSQVRASMEDSCAAIDDKDLNSERQGQQSDSERPKSRPESNSHRPSDINENRLLGRNENGVNRGICDVMCVCEGGSEKTGSAGVGGVGRYSGVRMQVVETRGDVPSPRWRHAVVLIHHKGKAKIPIISRKCMFIVHFIVYREN